MTQLGTFQIVSGTVWTGDPCYVLGADASHAPATAAKTAAAIRLAGLAPGSGRAHAEPFGPSIGIVLRARNGTATATARPGSDGISALVVDLPSDGPATRHDVYVGDVGVDAGIVWAGDPALTVGADAPYAPATWAAFCDLLFGSGATTDPQPLGPAAGAVTPTAYGDGTYPVRADFDADNNAIRIVVEFDFDDE